ncbi:50S ribosomal protein L28 [Dehalogenimonas sp. THU2]|uniref:50S ribosomal protein L28 n=1 Tax=Dehalogenimonas sp. THU2 TaxID=3151121 RepID=UPI00321887F3
MKCDYCGKTPQYGHNVSHSHRLTNKRSQPNCHPVRVLLDGKSTRLSLCTRCIRTLARTPA